MPNRPLPDASPHTSTSAAVAHQIDGGDAACWLAEVCPDCGALNESLAVTCWRCGISRSREEA